jgi:hypothetical protein
MAPSVSHHSRVTNGWMDGCTCDPPLIMIDL